MTALRCDGGLADGEPSRSTRCRVKLLRRGWLLESLSTEYDPARSRIEAAEVEATPAALGHAARRVNGGTVAGPESDTRPAYNSRLNTSRPDESVPSGWFAAGPVRYALMSTLYGSLAAISGAATAPAVSTSRISAPTSATRWRRKRCHTLARRGAGAVTNI